MRRAYMYVHTVIQETDLNSKKEQRVRVGEDTLKSIFGKILKIHYPCIWKIQ